MAVDERVTEGLQRKKIPVFICHTDLVKEPRNKQNINTAHGNTSDVTNIL